MITFIIPAHNEEFLLDGTISALHAAAGTIQEPYEIIVVDDESTDETASVAARFGARVITVHHRQIAATRNAGAAQAQGDLLLFVDADTHVPQAVACAAVDAMRSGAVGGGARARFDGRIPIYGRILARLWLWLQRFEHLASGCFLFCTRHAFEAVGGFDQTLYAAEDVELSKRLRRQGRFVILQEMVITSMAECERRFCVSRLASHSVARGSSEPGKVRGMVIDATIRTIQVRCARRLSLPAHPHAGGVGGF